QQLLAMYQSNPREYFQRVFAEAGTPILQQWAQSVARPLQQEIANLKYQLEMAPLKEQVQQLPASYQQAIQNRQLTPQQAIEMFNAAKGGNDTQKAQQRVQQNRKTQQRVSAPTRNRRAAAPNEKI